MRRLGFVGSVGLTWAAEDWSLKSEVIGYADQDRVSVINNESSTPGYWLVNLGFRWNPLQSLRVEARVDNLFDEDPPTSANIGSPFYSNYLHDVYGRVPYVRYEQDL